MNGGGGAGCRARARESESVQAAESAPAELEIVQATEPLLAETFTEGDGDEAKNEDAV